MKRIILILTILSFCSCNQRNRSSQTNMEEDEQRINFLSLMEDSPEFPGGHEALLDYLSENIIYPQTAIDKGIEGVVFAYFIIEENGSVTNIRILRGINEALDNETIRVISNMPHWYPAKIREKPVRSSYTLPVRFILDPEKHLTSKSGENKISDMSGIVIYPNPTDGIVNIELSEYMKNSNFQFIDMQGKILKTGEINSNRERIDISGFENGIYLLRIQLGEKNFIKTERIIKK